MVKVRISEMDIKPAPVSLKLSKVKFGCHGNQTIIVWQLKPYKCSNGSHSWTHCLTTVTIVGDVTMETKVCRLL
jgi:hypothetical protein